MAAIFGEGKIFGKLQILHSLDTLWVENFDEIALSRTVKEIEAKFLAKIRKFKMAAIFGEGKIFCVEANLCFAIFGKNSKIQNGRIFGEGKIFGKLQILHSLDFRKFRRNRSISHG